VKAAHRASISEDRIILFDQPNTSSRLPTVQDLIDTGLRRDATFIERRLAPGEAKTKIAFLSFSSGTTGRPKVLRYLIRNSECSSGFDLV
jgi:4-coumarate--CoA ligase